MRLWAGFSLQPLTATDAPTGAVKRMANPNPSPETRFKPGTPGNPGGKTKEQAQNEREAAKIAAELRLRMLSLMQERAEAGEDVLEMLDANALKLFKDSEDRAYGTPRQSVDHTTDGQPITPVTGIDVRIASAPSGDTDAASS